MPKSVYSNSDHDYLFRLTAIGDSGVGKSNIIQRYNTNEFIHKQATLGVDFCVKRFRINDLDVKVQIWDTAGQERFHAITTSYYRNANGILLVYDVTSRSSFANVNKWIHEILMNAPMKIPIMIIGNKVDLEHLRVVSYDEGKQLAETYGAEFIEASAMTNHNISEAFDDMINRILEQEIQVTRVINKSRGQPLVSDTKQQKNTFC